MVCHQRDKNEEAPGCIGGPTFDADTDFCAPAFPQPSYPQDTPSPTFRPVLSAFETLAPTPDPTFDPRLILLEFVGDDAAVFGLPLGLCQGRITKHLRLTELQESF